jgi:RND family efflux transporter MFP subunit
VFQIRTTAAKFLTFCALAAAPFVGAGCSDKSAATPPPPANVEVVAAVQEDIPIIGEWVATLDGYVNAQISPQVTGYLLKQNYREGSSVHKGEVLFEIDPRPFQALVDQAQGQLAQSRAQLGKAQLDVDRDTPLAAQRAIAQSQLDNDIQARLADEAVVVSSKASLEQAELNLEFTKVRSLVDGISGIAKGQIGDLVTPTTNLTTVSQVNPIKAYISISEQEYLHFAAVINANSLGQTNPHYTAPVPELILGDGTTYKYKGQFIITDRQVDPQTGTIRIAAAFPNPESILRPGQFGKLRATTETRKGAVLIPQRAVSELQGTYQIAVVGSDNKVTVRNIKIGERYQDMWIIEDGLKAGERVVSEGVQKARDGSTVNPTLVTAKPANAAVKAQ